jgi:hypothetical protein
MQLKFCFIFVWGNKIAPKDSLEMLVKLTTGVAAKMAYIVA